MVEKAERGKRENLIFIQPRNRTKPEFSSGGSIPVFFFFRLYRNSPGSHIRRAACHLVFTAQMKKGEKKKKKAFHKLLLKSQRDGKKTGRFNILFLDSQPGEGEKKKKEGATAEVERSFGQSSKQTQP